MTSINPGDFGSGTVVSGGVVINHTAGSANTGTLSVSSGGTTSFTLSNSCIYPGSVVIGGLDRTTTSGAGNLVLDSVDVTTSGGTATVRLRNSDATSGHSISGTANFNFIVD